MRRAVFLWLMAALLAACTDLSAVRDFAGLSAETGAYQGVVRTYEQHPSRMVRYAPSRRAFFEAQRAAREAQRQGLLALQQSLVLYMASLGKLAADEAVAFDTNPLSQAAAKAGAIDTSAAPAVTAVGNLLLRAATSSWRQREVAELIGAANPDVQQIVRGLRAFVNASAAEDSAELQAIDLFYRGLERRSGDPAAQQGMREWREVRDSEVAARRSSREAYLKALDAIGRGHQLLYENRSRLSVEESVRQIRAVEQELRAAGELLRPLVEPLVRPVLSF